MATQTFNPTDLSQSAANWAVAQRIVGPFAPHAQVTPNLTLALDPGYLLSGTTLTEVNAQSSAAFTPPSLGFRIDRVVIDRTTGAASIVAGTANSLTPPAIPSGKLPVARVMLQATTDAITNALVVDERALFDLTPQGVAVACRATFAGSNVQSVNSGGFARVDLTTVQFSVGSTYDTTNHRFLPTVAGYYMISAQVNIVNNAVNALIGASIYKNGVAQSWNFAAPGFAGNMPALVSDIVQLNGSTDYVELYCSQNNSGARSISGSLQDTWFSAARVA